MRAGVQFGQQYRLARKLFRVACVVVAACAMAIARQELSLGEVKQATANQAQPKMADSPESLAEQARRALHSPRVQQAPADTADSLGEQARRLVQDRILMLATGNLPRRQPFRLDIIVAPPAAEERSESVVAQSSAPARQPGAMPAGQQFSMGQIFHRHAQRYSSVPEAPRAVAQQPPTREPPRASEPPGPAVAPAPSPATAAVEPAAAPGEALNSVSPVQSEAPADAAAAPPALNIQTEFTVKYVAQNAVYLSSGRSAGLAEGMKLAIKRPTEGVSPSSAPVVADLEVFSVAASSAVCDVKNTTAELRPGDIAYLSEADAEMLAQNRAIGSSRKYPQVITFTEGQDPLDAEAREEVPRPPLPEINRARGRIGLDYSGISSRGTLQSSTNQIGGVLRADITRIGGTYWNLSGYWRGRFSNSSYAGQTTLQDLINRTYHLSLTYDSPRSAWVAGFGRLYLPWASSLDTLDGGYIGHRIAHGVIAGVFAGSTPDPTSWDYNPDRRIAGTFINFSGGSFDHLHYTSTAGIALSTLGWISDRPFAFVENGIFFKRYLSIYESAQADDPRPAAGTTAAGAGLSRSYVTVRFQPHRRIAFDLNHSYFREVPTFAQQLIGTGLVDKYLFQGLSAGVRVEPVRHITVYTDLGRSNRTGDMKNSLNQLYGISWDHIWKTGLRADFRTSRFDSSFGSGSYRSLGLSRDFGDRLHWQVQAGKQTLTSSLTTQGESRFLNSSLDTSFGRH